MNLEELKIKLWEHCLPYDDETIQKLDILTKLTLEANEKFNLTAINVPEDFIEKMIFDSCLGMKDREELTNKKILDFGSGAGFPGLVISILFPNVHVFLLEATTKKTKHLEDVVAKIGLKNVTVVNARGEEYVVSQREAFDIVIARAVAPLNILIELCAPFVKMGGYFIAMKGKGGIEEFENSISAIDKMGLRLEKIADEKLPFLNEERLNLVFNKSKKTPEKYPRQYSQILAKPL